MVGILHFPPGENGQGLKIGACSESVWNIIDAASSWCAVLLSARSGNPLSIGPRDRAMDTSPLAFYPRCPRELFASQVQIRRPWPTSEWV